MPRSRWTVAVLGGLSAALLVPSLALAAPSQSNVTVYATGGPATATVTGGPITGLGGVLGTLGFLLFAATLWPALGHLPQADST